MAQSTPIHIVFFQLNTHYITDSHLPAYFERLAEWTESEPNFIFLSKHKADPLFAVRVHSHV